MPFDWSLLAILAVTYIAFCTATVFYFVSRKGSGKLISALIKNGADSPERALTLGSLGCNAALIRFSLRSGGGLCKTVLSPDRRDRDTIRRVNGRRAKGVDFSTARFYLPPELNDKARSLYIGKRTKPAAIILLLLLLAAVLIALYFLIPAVFDLNGTGITV